jgi:hypothetical protein
MLKVISTKREYTCWLIGTSLEQALAEGKLYLVSTPGGHEIRKVEDQQPVIRTSKYDRKDLKAALNPTNGWRYTMAHPKKVGCSRKGSKRRRRETGV